MEEYNKIKSKFEGKCTHCAESKTSIVRKSLRDQLKKCKVAPGEEMRRYERGILLGMVTAFKITDDIDAVEAHNYLVEIVSMIDIER